MGCCASSEDGLTYRERQTMQQSRGILRAQAMSLGMPPDSLLRLQLLQTRCARNVATPEEERELADLNVQMRQAALNNNGNNNNNNMNMNQQQQMMMMQQGGGNNNNNMNFAAGGAPPPPPPGEGGFVTFNNAGGAGGQQ